MINLPYMGTLSAKDQYNKYASIYHKKRKDPIKNFWNEYIEVPAITHLISKDVVGKNVLDLGCGSGLYVKKLIELGAAVKGSDISEELIKIARSENPVIDFEVASAESLPYENNSFDVVVASLSLHYLQNLSKSFSEISRILRPNGIFVFSINHPLNDSSETIKVSDNDVRIFKPYFHNNPYTLTMKDGNMEFTLYHHTFENISQSLISSGFLISNIVEPRPIAESEQVDKKMFDRASNYPTFVIFRTVKVG